MEYILISDNFTRWRDKINKMIISVEEMKKIPDLSGKQNYVLSNDGINVEWVDIIEKIRPELDDINEKITNLENEFTNLHDSIFDPSDVVENSVLTYNGNSASWEIFADFFTKASASYRVSGTITAQDFNGNLSGNADSASSLETSRTIDGVSFNGTANISHYGTCSTAAATAAKVVNLSGFKLYTGSVVFVRFTVTNTASNPTLNVNNTGAKAIQYRNSAISAGHLAANRTYAFIYDGSSYELVGDIDSNTTYSTATESISGLNKLSDATNSTLNVSNGTAATPKSVKMAYDKAVSAASAASNAQDTADDALSTANAAQNAANAAQNTANSAQSTANAAQSTANAAQNTANTANSLAQSSQSTANYAAEICRGVFVVNVNSSDGGSPSYLPGYGTWTYILVSNTSGATYASNVAGGTAIYGFGKLFAVRTA